MDRREFMTSTGALLGACFTGAPVSAHAAGPTDAASFLADADRRATDIRAMRTPGPLTKSVRDAGLPDDHLTDTLAAFTVAAAFRDLPAEVQRDPRVQRRMRREGHRAGRQLLRTARMLRRIGRERRRALRAKLRSNPQLLDFLADGIRHSAGAHADPEHVEKIAGEVDRVVWRLRQQGPDVVIDEVAGKVERVAADEGLADDEWDDAVADDDTALPEDFAGGHAGEGPGERRSRRVARTGLKLLGIGAGTALVGGLLLATGAELAVVLGVLFLVTLGPLTFIVGLVFLVVAGFMSMSEEPAVGDVALYVETPYEAEVDGHRLVVRFHEDGSVDGTFHMPDGPIRSAGQWTIDGQALAFTLDGAGAVWTFAGTADGELIAVKWAAGDKKGGVRFGIGPAA